MRGSLLVVACAWATLVLAATACRAQEGDAEGPKTGTYTPGRGFKVVSSDQGELNIRLYLYLRYLNQLGLDPTYTNSFGTTVPIDRRQDIQFQKVVVYFYGWLMSPKFRYMAYIWTSNTSQGRGAQVVVGGNLNYIIDEHLTVGGGIDALPGVRTTEGNFPYWLTDDNRLISTEYFRPSYTMGIWAKGAVVDRVSYHVMLGNNMSQLGVDAGQLDDKLATVAASLVWLPSTGEFGPQGGLGDFADHQQVATRLAAHFTYSKESRQEQPNSDAFENVQIRLSDGSVIFQADLFGPGIVVTNVTDNMFATDAGVKYHGLSLEGEYYHRLLNELTGPGTNLLPFDEITDNGFQVLASGMAIPKALQVYGGGGKVYGDYGNPWEMRLGVNWYPWHLAGIRWNLEYLYTDRSPVGAASLPYLVGGTGDIIYTTFEVNF